MSVSRAQSQTIWWAQWVHDRYSALHEDRATMACCLELQAIGALAHSMTNPDMERCPSDIAQSESAKAWNRG